MTTAVLTSTPGAASRRSGYALVAVAAMGWGTWPFILRHAPMPAALQSTVLMVMVTVCSLPVMLRDRVRARARPAHWLGMAWFGVSDALNVSLFFAAYQRTSVAIAVLTHYLAPIFVAMAAPLIVGERMRSRTLIAVGVSFAGLALLLEPWRGDLTSGDLVGAGLGAASAVFYASNVLTNKRLAHVFSGSEQLFYHGFVAVPLLWIMVPAGALAATPPGALGVVLIGALGPGVLGGLSFMWGLRRVAASHASVLTLLEPFVAVLAAALLLDQRLGPVPVFGGALILAGAALVVTARQPRVG